jgi:hypothetical protein
MRRRRVSLFFFALLPVATMVCSLPALIRSGIQPAATEAAIQPSAISGIPGGAAATSSPQGPAASVLQTPVLPAFSPTPRVTPTAFSVSIADTGPLAVIHAPVGVVTEPYAILTAIQADASAGPVQVVGTVNLVEFVCNSYPCALPLDGSSVVLFRAVNASGQTSRQVHASIRVDTVTDGYLVTVESVSQFTTFADACAVDWGVGNEDNARWGQFYQSPYQLSTRKTLHHLATRLILSGVVDASACPGGGLGADLGWPNGCGLEKAASKMVEWQNQYDVSIWLASLQTGIPPRILKTLVEVESQYWPGNERFYVDEIGLGQVNHLGVDLLLRRNPTLYEQVCTTVLGTCFSPYLHLSPLEQAMVRGALVNSFNAGCSNCPFGVDLAKAQQSISLIAQTLRANCEQIAALDLDRDDDLTYEDYWRFTLGSYHSGYSCIDNAIRAARKADEPIDWPHVGPYVDCKGGEDYVNGFFGNLLSFDDYLLETGPGGLLLPGAAEALHFGATLLPTPTPIPAPTLIPSGARVHVRVFQDANANRLAEAEEFLNGVLVTITLASGTEFSGITLGGEVNFDMSSYPAGMRATVSLPGLYRRNDFNLPAGGVVEVEFIFTKPALPNRLP